MFKNRLSITVVAVLAFIAGGVLQPFRALESQAQAGCQTFKETGKTVCGRFLEYWNKNGGLAQQGLPLTGEFTEINDLDGKPYTVQYFERAVFEKHPENAGTQYDVLLSQLGTFQFKRKYPSGEPSGTPQPTQAPTAEQPLNFRGDQAQSTPPFDLSGGTYQLNWAVDLRGESQTYFGIELKSTDGKFSKLILNTIVKRDGSQSGSTFIYTVPKGQYYLAIDVTRAAYDVTLTKK